MECDKHCTKVLASTYNVCNFNDILEFHPGNKKRAFCTTHNKMCVIKKFGKSKHRDSFARTLMLVGTAQLSF